MYPDRNKQLRQGAALSDTSGGVRKALTCSVVIATRNRPDMLEDCLRSLALQTLPALEILIVDASDNEASLAVCEQNSAALGSSLRHTRAAVMGTSPQRNQGAQAASGDLLVFVDDDAVLEPDFLAALCDAFEADQAGTLGGVGGTITNQTFVPLSAVNRFVLRLCTGVREKNLAGRLVGPGISFLPADGAEPLQRVDWLNTTGTAYRRSVFLAFRFDENVLYPLEDLHLSARIARSWVLMNSTRARLFHNDFGRRTKRNWAKTGEGMILSRHSIAAHVLGKTGLKLYMPLFGYELLYCTLAMLWNGGQKRDFSQLGAIFAGKLKGTMRILSGRSLPAPPASAVAVTGIRESDAVRLAK